MPQPTVVDFGGECAVLAWSLSIIATIIAANWVSPQNMLVVKWVYSICESALRLEKRDEGPEAFGWEGSLV
jgi:hypothetical protein